MKRLLGIILLGILFVNQSNSLTIRQIDQDNKTIGYFDNDDLKDYIVREKKNQEKVVYSIFINNGKSYSKKISFEVKSDDFSEIENSLDNLFISNPKKGEIVINASCCGSFKSTESTHYKYFEENDNWILYKNSNSTIESDFLPTIEVQFLDFSYTIDNKNVKNNSSIKNKELSNLKITNETFFKTLFNKYKDANDNKTSNKVSGNLNFDDLADLLALIPIDKKNINKYNDLAYYIGESKNGSICSIFLLKEIIKKDPSRVVAYLNLADAQWNFDQKENASRYYKKYSLLMKSSSKDLTKIPQRVYDRIK